MNSWQNRTIVLLLALVGLLTASAPAADAPRPNIVVIVADDLGWADVGFNGGEIRTPNIDRIAAAGAKLEQFYVQPVCSPTRAALMTGRYPMRYGLQVSVVRPWADYGLALEERLLPAALKEAGYTTAICGKWHLGHAARGYLPTRRGFDHQYGHYNGAIDYFTHERDGGLDWHRNDRALREEGYSTALIAAEAAKLIREQKPDKPLFLYVPFNAVHTPLQVPDKYKQPYRSLPEGRQAYAGMLAAMDEGIGSILDALEQKNLRKNTLIIFCSDNGGFAPGRITSNGPFRAGKGTVYEGGVRVAACAAWEGNIPAGSAVNQPVHIVDLYPTLLNLAGAKVEQKLEIDGKDVWPTLARGEPSPHEQILLNATPAGGAIRVGDFKLVVNGHVRDTDDSAETPAAGRKLRPAEQVELFNLADDPSEKDNLAPSMPDRVKALRERYDTFARQAVPPKTKPKPRDFKSPAVWGERVAAHDFERWEKDIAAYEAKDRTAPPPKGGIVFVGSSTVRGWRTLSSDFPEHPVINRGFGGSQIVDAAHFADRIVLPYEPKQVFIRAGGNDVHAGKSAEQVFTEFKQFVDRIHAKLPETEVVFISLAPAPARWSDRDENKALNVMVGNYAKQTRNVGYVETYDTTVDADGQPRTELFIADQVHFNADGYKLLAERVRPHLSK